MKLSKLLYAIVNQILPVPQQILDQFYQKYNQFIKSKTNRIEFQFSIPKITSNIYNKQFFEFLFEKKIKATYVLSYKQNGLHRVVNDDICQIMIFCNKTLSDKDIIQHELKHCVQFWQQLLQDKLQQLHEKFNIQFNTYITDFCNLFTQIYKRLNRRFNVSLDTIIQKMIVDIVNNKTDINRFKNLLNNKSQFINYQKCIYILQIYNGNTTFINEQLKQLLPQNVSIDSLKNDEKYKTFLGVLIQHIKTNVKKINQYNIDDIIKNKDIKQIDLYIQKRLLRKKDIQKVIDFCMSNNLSDELTNLLVIYQTTNEQFTESINFLRDRMQFYNLEKLLQESQNLTEQQIKYIKFGE